ncbi:Inositolphosphorylceramide synthase subunit Kei1-domain-containing protein [Gloeopeniophorella convolvens]|nr:Inositolphosphorylceramide synthase subunit Kei1-domain-containing protein [Gloeopeniophorella convolvens]
MKLTLKRQLRPRPLASMLGILDLKTAVTVVVLFALLNKAAGIYGLIAMLTGAGGSAAQLTLYIYSALALALFAWGLRAVKEARALPFSPPRAHPPLTPPPRRAHPQEHPKHMLYFAHLFFADHILNTAWTVYFAVHWWLYTPHDGRRTAYSPAQQAIVDAYIGERQHMPEADRAAAAERIWRAEKGQALAIIILGWLVKFYFAALLYSFALHLRRGSYRSLPLSRTGASTLPKDALPVAADPASAGAGAADRSGSADPDADADVDAFYGAPPAHRTAGSGSAGSFADFVSAPPPRRARRTRGSLLAGGAGAGAGAGSVTGSSSAGPSEGEEDEVSSVGTGASAARARA